MCSIPLRVWHRLRSIPTCLSLVDFFPDWAYRMRVKFAKPAFLVLPNIPLAKKSGSAVPDRFDMRRVRSIHFQMLRSAISADILVAAQSHAIT